jgi:signal peptidase II
MLLLGLMAMFFLLDRLVKAVVQARLSLGESIPLIPQVFHITYVQNTGVAFSLFKDHPGILTLANSLFFAGFLAYALSRKAYNGWLIAIFSLILGGALGNLWDRLTLGAVIDYLDVTVIRYPVFNLADAFIFSGISLLIIATFTRNALHDANHPDASRL